MKERYYSLDIFRGATVCFMIMVNNQGSTPYWPLDHAVWHGCTPTDLIFPFFLFAVGNAMAFVMPRLEAAGTKVFLQKIIKRSLLIFFIGFFLNWCPFFRWSHDHIIFKSFSWIADDGTLAGVRVMGVLQRIALCYFFSAMIIYFFKTRGAFFISALLLLGYWVLCTMLGDKGDPYSLPGYFGTHVDLAILGARHMYHGEGVAFDPEGLMSTMAAITQIIFGYFVGQYIQQKGKNFEMLANLFVVAVVLTFAGYCWDMLFPLNKKIWTSSYVLYSTGLATITLCLLIFIIEFKNKRGAWSKFFDVFGKNPLFIFVLAGFLPRVLALIRIYDGVDGNGKVIYTSPLNWFYEHVCAPVSVDERNGSLLYAIVVIIVYWFIAYLLDRKKIYVKV